MLSKSHLLFLALAGSLFCAHVASACSCAGRGTVLDAYAGASRVVVVRAVSVEKAEPGAGYEGIASTKMIVEKVFKGDLKVGDELTVGQGSNVDCIVGFYQPVGQQFLFYLGPREKNSKALYIGSCGRSRGVRDAEDTTDDLLYLNKLETMSGKTRISGTIQFVNGPDVGVEGRAIRIIGSDKSYEVRTNKDGVYEIYGLPAGNYRIEPETPAGWELAEADPLQLLSRVLGPDPGRSPKQITVSLGDKGHASGNILYEREPKQL